MTLRIAYARTGEGWGALKNEIAATSSKKRALFEADTPKDYWFFAQIKLFFDHDHPLLERLRSPVLVILGGKR